MAIGDKHGVTMQFDEAVPEGVATLDENGILAEAQRPAADELAFAGGTTVADAITVRADLTLSNLSDHNAARLNLGAASSPNLLDNWYFADPIDQRAGYVVPPGTAYYSDTALTT